MSYVIDYLKEDLEKYKCIKETKWPDKFTYLEYDYDFCDKTILEITNAIKVLEDHDNNN